MGMLFIRPIYQARVVKWPVDDDCGIAQILNLGLLRWTSSYHRVIVSVAMANRVSTDGESVGP
jgi:hypothetical protein